MHKSRVRTNSTRMRTETLNIHDRVNLAAEKSYVYVDKQTNEIVLNITIDTHICSVMDYFEIYFARMQLCRRAADFLGSKFVLIITVRVWFEQKTERCGSSLLRRAAAFFVIRKPRHSGGVGKRLKPMK